MPLVSIVIPAYNQARYLGAAVESALAQTHSPVEVIVVNDGSTDDTVLVLEPFRRTSNVRIVEQANAGLPAARNRGLSAAGGDFVVFLDSDDRLDPSHVARLVSPLVADPALGWACCDVQIVDEADAPSSDYSVRASRRVVSGDLLESLLVGGYFPPHAALVRRSVLDALGPFALDLGGHADYELWLRLAANGTRAAFVDERLALYRVYDGSMSRNLEHMRATREGALERVMRSHPARVARALSAVQELSADLHAANAWLRKRLEPEIAQAEADQAEAVWSLLERLDQARLTNGDPKHLAVWDTTLGGTWTRAVFLHPPATLEAVVPTGVAGRLKGSFAIHPDAWAHQNACACTFSLDVDRMVATTALLDPTRRAADRRWVAFSVDVPASPAGRHIITLETQAVGAPYYGWALFKDVTFAATT